MHGQEFLRGLAPVSLDGFTAGTARHVDLIAGIGKSNVGTGLRTCPDF